MTATPTFPTWITREVLSTSKLNQIASTGEFAKNQPAAIATRPSGAVLSIPNNTFTAVTMTVENFDNMAGFAATSSTITTTYDGVWIASGGGSFAVSATGVRLASVRKNGADQEGGMVEWPAPNGSGLILAAVVATASVGDTFALWVLQNSGGALNIDQARIAAARVSGT